MTTADIERIEAAAERVRLPGKTSKAQEAAVIAQALGYPLSWVVAALGREEEVA